MSTFQSQVISTEPFSLRAADCLVPLFVWFSDRTYLILGRGSETCKSIGTIYREENRKELISQYQLRMCLVRATSSRTILNKITTFWSKIMDILKVTITHFFTLHKIKFYEDLKRHKGYLLIRCFSGFYLGKILIEGRRALVVYRTSQKYRYSLFNLLRIYTEKLNSRYLSR